MGKKLNTLLITLVSAIIIIAPFSVHASATGVKNQSDAGIGVTYSSHVQNIGWQAPASNGGESGTDGKGLRLEALQIHLTGALPVGAGITYQTQVQNVGWQDWVSDGVEAGTDGRGFREEAIRIKLVNLQGYSVQYRVHVQNVGWQDWVSDGVLSGTVGRSLRLEALEIKIVPPLNIHPTSVGINKITDNLVVGGTDNLNATVAPTNATNKTVMWTSSDSSIATVDNTGKVTAVNTGVASITVTTADGNRKGTCTVTVNIPVVGEVTTVGLNKTADTLVVGSTDILIATVAPSNAINKAVTWTSSDNNIASVDNKGKVTAISAGIATITVTTIDGSKTANTVVTVNNSITYITNNETLINETINGDLYVDENVILTIVGNLTVNGNLYVHGCINDYGYLRVVNTVHLSVLSWDNIISNGKICMLSNQSINMGTDIGAMVFDIGSTVDVTSINLNKNIDSLTIGGTDNLIATINPIDATNKNVIWKSSDTSIATVDNTGKVTAVGSGTVAITATTVDGNKTGICNVTIDNPVIKVTAIGLNKVSDTLIIGDTDNLTATITPTNSTNKAVSWASSDNAIVTVDNLGKIEAVSVGAATITATSLDGSKIDTCTVTVAADPIIADYTYTVTDGKAKIVKYTGAGGIVIIPSTLAGFPVTSIGDSAFYGCSSLITTNIPAGITSIGYNAFGSCWSLTSITVAVDNPNYSSINGVLYNKAGTTLIAWSGGLTTISIPQSVTSIGDYAFYGNRVTTISIPLGLTSIGNGAFYGSGLTTISIPEGVTSIGNQAFSACTSLTNIPVNPANLYYTSIDGMLFNKTGTILIACPGGLTTVNIPQGVTSIGDEAFQYCTGITTINIPQEVTSIGDSAFSCCSSLTNITVNAANLNFISINGVLFNKTGTILIACPDGLTTLNIPEGVTSIGNYAFEGSGLTNISISQGVTSIGNWTFYGCNGLTTINIPQGVTSIGFQAFTYCTGLTNIKFNSATTSIYDSADTIPDTTKIIGYDSSTAKDYATKYNKIFEVNSINK